MFCKAGGDAVGAIDGRRHTMRSDFLAAFSGHQAKAVVHAIVSSIAGTTQVLANAGPEHQGAPGANRPLNWNLLVVDEHTEQRLEMSDYAAAHGGRVLALNYPGLIPVHYTFMSSVFDAVPNWSHVMTLEFDDKVRALRDPAVRERLRAGLASPEGQLRPIAHIEGHTIEVGDWVEVGIGSANRDLPDGDEFRLDRADPRDHLAFGAGSRVCPGATLARLEAATAVEALLDRCASIEGVEGASHPPVPGSLGYAPIPVVLVSR